MTSKNLNCFVYWSQNKDQITLKVDLKDVKNFSVKADKSWISFTGTGVGSHGLNEYKFLLDLYEAIDPETIKSYNLHSKIDVVITKISPSWWPRLVCQPQKPAWLKIDFDRWQSEEDVDEDDPEKPRNVMNDYPTMFENLQKEELGYRKEQTKKVYLVLYNLFQFIGFSYILIVMAIRWYRDGPKSIPTTYEAVGNAFKFVQLLQYLEVMHPMFGYTKGSAMVPFMQCTGRAFVLFAMIENEVRMQTKPAVFYLFVVWASVEVFRYPYYITSLFQKEIYILTWIRYTIWIPLYPLGVLCEGIIILRNIPYFEETGRFTVLLPNKYNATFHMPTFMYLYLIFLILPGIFFIITHMQKARMKKLGSGKRAEKFD